MNEQFQWLGRVVLTAGLVFSTQQIHAADDNVSRQRPLPIVTPGQNDTVSRTIDVRRDEEDSDAQPVASHPCHWWQFHRCSDDSIEGLPREAPRVGTIVTVDISRNTAYLFRDGQLIAKGPAATGSEKVLRHRSKIWAFHTPRGHLKVLRRIEDPIWRKPDWAFVEAGQAIPAPNAKSREVKGHLGKYALDLGDGIMIHGTDDSDSLGRYVSHGCVRLPAGMLSEVWSATRVGTDVYIFESREVAVSAGVGEHHSDLDLVSVKRQK